MAEKRGRTKYLSGVLGRLEIYLNATATEAERPVVSYILAHPRQSARMDIHTLAKQTDSSAATIVRVCKKIGFTGFKTFKNALLSEETPESTSLEQESVGTEQAIAKAVMEQDARGLDVLCQTMDWDLLVKTAAVLKNAPTIHVYGIGASYLVAQDFAMKWARVHRPVILFSDYHLQKIDSTGIRPSEICLIISYSGRTKEMLEIAANIRKNQGILVTLTGSALNPLMRFANYALTVPSLEQNLRVGAFSSRLMMLSVVDALFQLMRLSMPDQGHDSLLKSKQAVPKLGEEPDEARLDNSEYS